jgi:hypothetical protein
MDNEKHDLFRDLEDIPKDGLNNNKMIQQIVLLNIKRSQLKVALMDILQKRNETMAYRLLTRSYMDKKDHVFERYQNARLTQGIE